MYEIDCLGLSCPIPLVKLQKGIAAHPGETILMKVDTETAKDHATRLAEGKGYTVAVKGPASDGEIQLELTPGKK